MKGFSFLFFLHLLLAISARDFFGNRHFQSSPKFNGDKVKSDGGNEYYNVLGVDKKASESDIKKAYRQKVSSLA